MATMSTISIETAKPQENKTENKTGKQREAAHQPLAVEDPRGAGDAMRFKGQPLTLFARLERAMQELTFYKGNLRHRTDAETSDPRAHDEWRRAAVALARELADEVEAGLLEPNAEVQKKLAVAQTLIDEAMKAQRGA